jgi:hypothetical protein
VGPALFVQVIKLRAGAIVPANVLDNVAGDGVLLSCTVIVKLYGPGALGVPPTSMTAGPPARIIQAGKPVVENVYAATPPLA